MNPLRIGRIAAIAAALAYLFVLSQRITVAREGATPPGVGMALGAISVLFMVRAVVTERSPGPARDWEKDLLWGLAAGGLCSVASLWM